MSLWKWLASRLAWKKARGISAVAMRVPDEFSADCIFEGTPVRFRADGSIDAIVDGRVIVFRDFVHFVEEKRSFRKT
ncbi:hypothetical protein [Bradyrhizobium sp. I1.7.5]|uniref:hypothetical protein n=1 Tax=Bradyrhizobium sp. I1.7.5 TaxID=3156363 RepID=UPI00339760EB